MLTPKHNQEYLWVVRNLILLDIVEYHLNTCGITVNEPLRCFVEESVRRTNVNATILRLMAFERVKL
jgi:hypothetical protein